MSRDRRLEIEALETRLPLSHATAAAPLILDGTLSVKKDAAYRTTNSDGSTTTTIPVSGALGSLGKVRGFWFQNFDMYGNYMSPDSLNLKSGKGSVSVIFDHVTPTHVKGKIVSYNQRAHGETGAVQRSVESGTLELIASTSRKSAQTIVIQSAGSSLG